MSKNLSRVFSSAARVLKEYTWIDKSNTDITEFKNHVKKRIAASAVLSEKVHTITVEGNPHETCKKDGTVDPTHISGRFITTTKGRLTSYHAYGDGRVVFSVEKFNEE
ncbi:hypothetical protein E4U55_007872 [Claviceps digitariae]|nr:hypothetical protein E4U55_007872 [Claviceps digitariae]